MPDFIDSFLAGLEADKSQPREDYSSERLNKILMSAYDNQGTIVIAPFQDTVTGKPYLVLDGVREYKTTNSKFKEGKDEVWHRILPKAAYGELTEEQTKLYDEVVGLFDTVAEYYDELNDSWSKIRTKNYSLFQGIVMSHFNTSKERIDDYVGKAALLMFPSKAPINALATAIDAKIAAMGGNKGWIPAVFAPSAEGRDGVMSISFASKPDNGIGYNCSIGFEFNSAYAKVVPVEGFSEDEVKKLGCITEEFLGWMNGDNSLFNTTIFTELRDALKLKLKEFESATPTPQTEALPNQNGVDPMTSTTTAGSPAESAGISTSTADATPGKVKLPF